MELSKTFTKLENSNTCDFLNLTISEIEKELVDKQLKVIDCHSTFLEKIVGKFKCPVQLSMLEDSLTFHMV
jgi:hypothetical protein